MVVANSAAIKCHKETHFSEWLISLINTRLQMMTLFLTICLYEFSLLFCSFVAVVVETTWHSLDMLHMSEFSRSCFMNQGCFGVKNALVLFLFVSVRHKLFWHFIENAVKSLSFATVHFVFDDFCMFSIIVVVLTPFWHGGWIFWNFMVFVEIPSVFWNFQATWIEWP